MCSTIAQDFDSAASMSAAVLDIILTADHRKIWSICVMFAASLNISMSKSHNLRFKLKVANQEVGGLAHTYFSGATETLQPRAHRLPDMETAFTSLDAQIKILIAARREELEGKDHNDSERKDVFRLMLRASQGQGTLSMTDDELAGNTYLMLMAGHALYEDIQEEVYHEIRDIVLDHGKLRRSREPQAAASSINREVVESVVLKTDEEDGHGGQIILEPGTMFAVDLIGLHPDYNPKYFPEPEEFRPSRWYGTADNDMTMFSLGPQTSRRVHLGIGRRFAVTEGVAFLSLSNLVRDWRLQIVLNPGETKTQWRARVMKASGGLTLGVGTFPVRLTRR
ncbi:cytochrome P450 [Mycena olivaceomarginata]|nr:cytochrome P450 [Mycena olivaceomarginata]